MRPNKWLERTMLASRRLLEGGQAPRRFARRSATPLGPVGQSDHDSWQNPVRFD
jgi:hypothetical protein